MREGAAGRWEIGGARHGPLPVMLLGLTAVTGLVDAVSVLRLGRVFVAHMTGTVVFAGFAIAGVPGFALSSQLFALAGFALGAVLGGGLIRTAAHDRARLLATGASCEVALLAVACAVTAAAGESYEPPVREIVASLLAIAMGVQNTVVRRLAVPDMTTTVVTMDIIGVIADRRAAHGDMAIVRRLLAIASILVGAIVGASLVRHATPAAALALATGLLATVTAVALLAARRQVAWRDDAR